MYRVIEVARMLGVSKVTIYKKMRYLKDEIKPYVVKDKNVTHITGEGVELIKSTIQIQDYESESKDSLKLVEAENKISEIQKNLDRVFETNSELVEQQKYMQNAYRAELEKRIEQSEFYLKHLEQEMENARVLGDELKKQLNLFIEINKQVN